MRAAWLLLVVAISSSSLAEDVFRERFEAAATSPPLSHTWGDVPSSVVTNKVEPGAGPDGSAAAHLVLSFPDAVQHKLSYWAYTLAEPIPLAAPIETISFKVKTNVPVSIKIGIAPFNFIYHGPTVGASDQWQTITLRQAFCELKKWCEGGKKTADEAWIRQVIVAVHDEAGAKVDVLVDDVAIEGAAGSARAIRAESLARRAKRVRIAPISLIWDEGCRTLESVLAGLDEAGMLQADLACLPEECVYQAPEPIPGPTSSAIAAKAAEHHMYVVGNLRERAGDKTYVTSFLCDRAGKIVGIYRKSHRMPNERGFELGDDLTVLQTDFGAVGLKIGTDHYFPEIDTVLGRRGARLIVWSTSPMPMRDEHMITLAIQGRAVQNGLHYAVARYAGKHGYGGYDDAFSWMGTWPLGRAQVFDADGHTIADSGHAGGVALAVVPAMRLGGSPRDGGYETTGTYALITAPKPPDPLPRSSGGKRIVRAAAIECEPNIDRLIAKLDACGRQGCDIVCLWEYVWYESDKEAIKYRDRNRGYLARIAEAAKRNRMYVVIAGELERGFNESILYDRQGHEIGRYTKIVQTTPKTSKFYQAGDKVGIFDLDFGRICTKICADVYSHEIDRVAALYQVDLMLHPSQDAGPFTEHTRLREAHRCVDNGYFLVRAASPTAQTDHRTYIMDPWGMVLGASQVHTNNAPVVVALQLDNRPKYLEWPEEVRKRGPYPDPTKSKIRPVAKGDLRAVINAQRRPELYCFRKEPASQ
jgi:predicted amidohydrolase